MPALRNPFWLLGFLSAGLYGLQPRLGETLVALRLFEAPPERIVSYLWSLLPLSLLYAGAVWLVLRPGEGRRVASLPLVIVLGLLFRLPLAAETPFLSSDIYRYLWDGRVQASGEVNPYLFSPADEELAALRDDAIHPHINRKEARTVYPAGAELLFGGAALAGLDTPGKFRAAGLLAEALTLALLVLILGHLRLPPSRVLIYAWNPLVVFEAAQGGHVEVFMIPAVLAFVYLFLKGRVLGAGVALGIAASIKLLPALLVFALPRGRRLSVLLPLLVVVGLAYLPYVGAGGGILGFLPAYFSDPYEIFNPGPIQKVLFWGSHLASAPVSWSRFVLAALLLLILIPLALRRESHTADLVSKAYGAIGAYLVLIYPAFHPWYLCWMIPFVCLLSPMPPAWLYLSLVLPLSYLKYLAPGGAMPLWVPWVEFAPLYGLLAWEYFSMKPIHERSSQWSLASRAVSSTTL